MLVDRENAGSWVRRVVRNLTGWRAYGAAALIVGVDAGSRRLARHKPTRAPFLARALHDESAHLGTGLLALAAGFRTHDAPFLLGAVAAGNLIDLDHLPGLFGNRTLQHGVHRPYSHSLTSVAALLLAARLLSGGRRRVALGGAFGLAVHLVRDMGTGGLPLFWPLTRRTVGLPYPAYATALFVTASRTRGGPACGRFAKGAHVLSAPDNCRRGRGGVTHSTGPHDTEVRVTR